MSASSSLSSVKESEIAEESRVERSPTAEEIHEDAQAAEAAAEAAKEEAQIAHRRATKARLPAAPRRPRRSAFARTLQPHPSARLHLLRVLPSPQARELYTAGLAGDEVLLLAPTVSIAFCPRPHILALARALKSTCTLTHTRYAFGFLASRLSNRARQRHRRRARHRRPPSLRRPRRPLPSRRSDSDQHSAGSSRAPGRVTPRPGRVIYALVLTIPSTATFLFQKIYT